jgi:hypothetical protein
MCITNQSTTQKHNSSCPSSQGCHQATQSRSGYIPPHNTTTSTVTVQQAWEQEVEQQTILPNNIGACCTEGKQYAAKSFLLQERGAGVAV